MPRYRAFGVTFDVDFVCPQCDEGTGDPDVDVRLGTVPDEVDDVAFQGVAYAGRRERILLTFPNLGRFLVEDGRSITYAPEPDAPLDALRTFFLGPVFGTVLLQRGALPLHASACVSDRGAVLLAGYSGRGKSTLLTALVSRGFEMLADDLSAVTLRDGVPVVHRGFGSVRLRSDSLVQMGGDPDTSDEVRPGINKFWWPLGAHAGPEVAPVMGVCVLTYGSTQGVECDVLTGQARVAALVEQTYARSLAQASGLAHQHFIVLGALAAGVPVLLIKRPRGLGFVDQTIDRLLSHLQP